MPKSVVEKQIESDWIKSNGKACVKEYFNVEFETLYIKIGLCNPFTENVLI